MNNDQITVANALSPLVYISTFIQEIIDEHTAFANSSHSMQINPEMQQMKLGQIAQTQKKMDKIKMEISLLEKLIITDVLEHSPLSSAESNFFHKVQDIHQALKKLVNI